MTPRLDRPTIDQLRLKFKAEDGPRASGFTCHHKDGAILRFPTPDAWVAHIKEAHGWDFSGSRPKKVIQ